MCFHYNHDFPMSTLPVRFAWSKVISRGGCFDGLSDLDEIFPSVKTDLNSDRRISPSSVGKYVTGIPGIMYSHYRVFGNKLPSIIRIFSVQHFSSLFLGIQITHFLEMGYLKKVSNKFRSSKWTRATFNSKRKSMSDLFKGILR